MKSNQYPTVATNARMRYVNEWGAAVLYAPQVRKSFSVNSTAYYIWRMCDGRRTVANIAAQVADELGADSLGRHRIQSEAEGTIKAFARLGVMLLSDTTPDASAAPK